MINKKTFCMAPFKAALIDNDGGMMPCCEYMPAQPRQTLTKVNNINQWWTVDLENLRNDMREGRSNPGCHHCYNKEKNPSYVSVRQHFNSYYNTQNINLIDDIDFIEIRVSNYCNLKCIMCGPYASSSISQECKKYENEYKDIGIVMSPKETIRWWDNTDTLDRVKTIIANVSSINFAGGEPLIVPEVIDLLNALDPTRIKKISFNTNLTRVSDNFLLTISKFKFVAICVSLEGYGIHNDYVRFGSEWNDIENNINKLIELKNVRLSINHVLQHTSIFSLPDLIKFAGSINLPINLHNIYVGPNPDDGMLTLNSVAQEDIDTFNSWLETYQGRYKSMLQNWINTYNFNKELQIKFNNYINLLDSIRGCNFKRTFKITA